MHPSFDILGSKGAALSGKKIVLALTGSIACVKAFDLCRALMRQGAEVKVVMSAASTKILHPEAMHYASGSKPVTEITGGVEHIEYFGEQASAGLGKQTSADLLLICPATANVIGKVAHGVDDTPVTTFATTAIGSGKPVLIVPAMHYSMYSHPIVNENILKLKEIGINFLEPKIEEDKAKLPEIEEIVLEVMRILGGNNLKGKKVLVSSGATREHIDSVRFISNRSSGSMGRELAKAAYAQGAYTTIVHSGSMEKQINSIKVETSEEMREALLKELESKKYDYFISAAAVSDFNVGEHKGKLKSDSELNLKLLPSEKIINEIKKKNPTLKIVAFKAESGKSEKELEKIAKEFLQENNFSMVVANNVETTMGKEGAEVLVISKHTNTRTTGLKSAVAEKIISLLP